MSNSEIVILGSARTPMGAFQGELSNFSAPQLGAFAIKAAVERSGLSASDINEILMGCVLPAGLGQAPARQAALGAGLPHSAPCTTVNKMCGSGMKTVMMAYEALHARPSDIIIAGGMESMTNSPYILPKVRAGLRLGHSEVKDHMFLDGLEDAYDKGKLMGVFAEATAEKYGFTREAQDQFALESLNRAQKATESGAFMKEITALTLKGKGGEVIINTDESPRKALPEKIPTLKPAFKEGGTVTAANSSSISDGGAALVLTTAQVAKAKGLSPMWRIVGASSFAQAPAWFTTAPVGAINGVLSNIGWTVNDVDLFEINEAFAVVAMAAMKENGIPHDKMNVHGGACALGHPIGASGARIIVSLIHALELYNKNRGVAALCIGGGEATAVAVERV